MTRKFKKEIIKEIESWLVQTLTDFQQCCSRPGRAIEILNALADHGALSENAYEEEPFEIDYCPHCKRSIQGRHWEHGIEGLRCPATLIKMREVK